MINRRSFLKILGGIAASVASSRVLANKQASINKESTDETKSTVSPTITTTGVMAAGDIFTIGDDLTKYRVTKVDNSTITCEPNEMFTSVTKNRHIVQPYYRRFERKKRFN